MKNPLSKYLVKCVGKHPTARSDLALILCRSPHFTLAVNQV
jgi:hypothetical protein